MAISKQLNLTPTQAALWFLGQSGYLLQTGEITVAIDPYLTDSVGVVAPEFSRLFPSPLAPEELKVDLFIVTHDHLDHLDSETITRYPHKGTTTFIAPRFAARKLHELGVSEGQIQCIDVGVSIKVKDVMIEGVFALPTSTDAMDTAGYHIIFPNGRSAYHTSDTGYCPFLLKAVPQRVDVLLVAINGKWGNLSVPEAVEVTRVVEPRFVLPNHYDMMALNAENPEAFRYFCQAVGLKSTCVIPTVMQPFIWGETDESI